LKKKGLYDKYLLQILRVENLVGDIDHMNESELEQQIQRTEGFGFDAVAEYGY